MLIVKRLYWLLFLSLLRWRYVLASLVSMRGREYITYDIGKIGFHKERLHIVFRFKTIDPSGVLIFSENTDAGDFISLELIDGKLRYKGRLGSNERNELSMIVGSTLNDYQWHTVNMKFQNKSITLQLDTTKQTKSFKGEHKTLDLTERLYVGGVEDYVDVSKYKTTKRKYSGCLSNLMFNEIDMLYNAKFSKPHFSVSGDLLWNECEDIDYQPIMFSNPQDYAYVPTYLENSLSVSFRFRTNTGKGMLFLKESKMVHVSLRLERGKVRLYVSIDLGNGDIKLELGENLDDGFWHRVEVMVNKEIIKFKLDDRPELTHRSPFAKLVSFYRSNATLGGGEEHIMKGFVGCMYDIWVDDTRIDYNKLHSDFSMGVVKKCHLNDFCLFSPCKHGGKCLQDHKSFRCDCMNTLYSGQTCEKSIYQPSCQSYKDLGLDEDAYCTIDPDGDQPGGVNPVRVLCNMTQSENKAVTIFNHNLNGDIPVSKGQIDDHTIFFEVDYRIEIETFEVLLKNAVKCKQHIKFKCKNALLMNSPRGPPHTIWTGRSGNNEDYWGGANPDSGMCACGMNKSCADPFRSCNCDIGDNVTRSDEGFLREVDRLPVLTLSFNAKARESSFSLGHLECEYNSTKLPKSLSKDRILKACEPLNRKPTTRPFVTTPKLSQNEKVINWNKRTGNRFDGNSPSKKHVAPVVSNVNVNLTLELPKIGETNPQDGLKFTLSVYAVIVIAVATVIVVIIIAIVVIAKRCQGEGNNRSRHYGDHVDYDDDREETTEMCTFFGALSSASRSESNRPVIEVHRHSIHCETLDELPPAYREFAQSDYANQPITTHIDLSYKPRKKTFFC